MTWDTSVDVLVVGFGVAGASAALEAVAAGSSVLAIDRALGGGASTISGGIYYAGGGTVTVLEAERSIFFTIPLQVIVAVPYFTAVTFALLSTVATDASLEEHVRFITFRISIGRAFMSAADSAN